MRKTVTKLKEFGRSKHMFHGYIPLYGFNTNYDILIQKYLYKNNQQTSNKVTDFLAGVYYLQF